MNLETMQRLSQRVMNGKGLFSKDVDIHFGLTFSPANTPAALDEDGDPIPVNRYQECKEID